MDFLGLGDTAEATPRRTACVFGGKALPEVLLSRFGKMTGDLVIDLAIHLPSTKEGRQPAQEDPQACHDGSSEIFRKRSTMLAARCHCASSLWSCLRPAAVSA